MRCATTTRKCNIFHPKTFNFYCDEIRCPFYRTITTFFVSCYPYNFFLFMSQCEKMKPPTVGFAANEESDKFYKSLLSAKIRCCFASRENQFSEQKAI